MHLYRFRNRPPHIYSINNSPCHAASDLILNILNIPAAHTIATQHTPHTTHRTPHTAHHTPIPKICTHTRTVLYTAVFYILYSIPYMEVLHNSRYCVMYVLHLLKY